MTDITDPEQQEEIKQQRIQVVQRRIETMDKLCEIMAATYVDDYFSAKRHITIVNIQRARSAMMGWISCYRNLLLRAPFRFVLSVIPPTSIEKNIDSEIDRLSALITKGDL